MSDIKTPGTFTCCICHGTFDKRWSDDEAKAEYEQLYGSKNGTGWERSESVACDDCWKASGLDTGDEGQWRGPAAAAAAVAKARGEHP